LRTEDGSDLGGAPGGEEDDIGEVEVSPELGDHFIGYRISFGETFIRVVHQEVSPCIVITADNLVMTQPGVVVRVQSFFDQQGETGRHEALEHCKVPAYPPQASNSV
jgi:hypothetical protein